MMNFFGSQTASEWYQRFVVFSFFLCIFWIKGYMGEKNYSWLVAALTSNDVTVSAKELRPGSPVSRYMLPVVCWFIHSTDFATENFHASLEKPEKTVKEEEAEPQRQTSQPQEKQEAAAVEPTKDTKKDSRRFVFLKFYMHMQTSGKSYIYLYSVYYTTSWKCKKL